MQLMLTNIAILSLEERYNLTASSDRGIMHFPISSNGITDFSSIAYYCSLSSIVVVNSTLVEYR